MSETNTATTTPHRGDPARSRVGLAVLLILAWSLLFALIVHAVERIARPPAIDTRDAVSYHWLDTEGQAIPGRDGIAKRQRLDGYVVQVPEGVSTLRYEVDFDVTDPRVPQALYLAIREEIREIRVNGQPVQPADPVPRMEGLLTSEPAYYPLSPRLLRAGVNRLEIDKQAQGLAMALSEFAIGPADALAKAFRARNFLLTDLALIGVGILTFTLLLCLAVNWPAEDRPRIRALMLLLGCCAASTAFLTFSPPFPMGLKSFVLIWSSLNLASAIAIAAFVAHEVRVPMARVRRIYHAWLALQGVLLLAFVLVTTLATNLQSGLLRLVNASYVTVCVSGALAIVLLAFAVARDRGRSLLERSLLALCLSALVLDRVGSIVDLHSPFDAALPLTLSWSPIVGACFGLAMVFALAREAAQARRTVIEANARLAERLAIREQELQASYAERAQWQKHAAVMDERARIVRDMHDGIGGKLTGLRLQADSLTGPALAAAIDDSLTDLRLIVDSLDTAEDGLTDALFAFERRIRPQARAAGCELIVEYHHDRDHDRLGPRKTLHVMRLLQEAVTNALRHAMARRLRIATRLLPEGLIEITVADDGRGLDPAQASGIGMDSMRHRAQAMAASIDWQSTTPGTVVTLRVPIDESEGTASASDENDPSTASPASPKP